MFDNYLFGLYQGLVAGTVLALLTALAAARGPRPGPGAVHPVSRGAAVAAAVALLVALLLEFASAGPTPTARQALTGALSSAAGAVLLWTAFRTGRAGAVPSAPGLLGAGALLAVGQQGPEPALYFWSAVRSAADPAGSALPLVLTLLGLGTAVGLCGLFLMGLRRLPPAVFPRVAGAALAVLAAGLLARGAAALQDAGLLGTGMGAAPVFDLGPVLPPDRLYGTVVTGVLGPPTAPAALPFALWSLGLLAALALALAPVIRSALLRCRPGPTESG